jgi:L-histidine N-alpha-methyltransferase
MTSGFQIDIHLPPDSAARALESDVRRGLAATPKSLPPKWFYDKVGSDLFEEITRLPEYYPTRAEAQILQQQSGAIAKASGADALVELGSGSSTKTRLLLDALQSHQTLRQYVALDVSAAAIEGASSTLVDEYPGLGCRLRPPPQPHPTWWLSAHCISRRHDRQLRARGAPHVPE